jgi:hypothetical protein
MRVTLLRQIELSKAQGKFPSVACRDAGISLQSYAMACQAVILQLEKEVQFVGR